MNRAELRDYARRYLSEAGSGVFTDEILNRELNRAARSLAGQLGLIRADVTATTDAEGKAVIPGLVNVIRVSRMSGYVQPFPVVDYAYVDSDPRGWNATGGPRALVVDEAYLGRGIVRPWPVSPGTEVTVHAFVDGGDMTTDDSEAWAGRFDVYHDVIAYHAAHALIAHRGSRNAQEPTWYQRYQLRLEELRDRGTAGSLIGGTRMGSILRRDRQW